jgi:CRISPR-associated endonuclease Csy4
MNYYLDLKVVPDSEFNSQTLLNILFGKLHFALVNLGDKNVGVSFPNFSEENNRLGDCLRLHSNSDSLDMLAKNNWMRGIKDYTVIGEVNPVPESVSYRTVSRYQVKSNPEKERRRLIKRKNITQEEAMKLIPDNTAKRVKLPYIEMKSCSRRARFKLFIKHSELLDKPAEGVFSKYGLSATATIPWF